MLTLFSGCMMQPRCKSPLAAVLPPSAPGNPLCTQRPKALAAAGDRSKSQQGSPFQHGLSWAPVFAQFAREEVCRLPDQLRLILPRYALSHLARLSRDRQTGHFSPEAESAGEKNHLVSREAAAKAWGEVGRGNW